MKLIHIAGVATLVSCLVFAGGCSTVRKGLDESKVTFLTKDCGEFTFQRQAVMQFLELQKAEHPKAADLFVLLSGQKDASSVKLSCEEYCPILFNGMLSMDNDFLVRCKGCKSDTTFDKIKGKFADASLKEIQYVDNGDHVLITVRLDK